MYMSAPVSACAYDFCKSKDSKWVERNLFEVIFRFIERNDDTLYCVVVRLSVWQSIFKDFLLVSSHLFEWHQPLDQHKTELPAFEYM